MERTVDVPTERLNRIYHTESFFSLRQMRRASLFDTPPVVHMPSKPSAGERLNKMLGGFPFSL
jgi:hypothetical protein